MAVLASRTASHECLGRVAAPARSARRRVVEGDVAGDLAAGVAAHAVGDREQGDGGEDAVLVDAAQAPDVGGRAPAQPGHHTASRTVEPTCRLSPLCIGVGALTRWPFT